MTQEIYNSDGTPNPAGLIGKTITSVRELNAEESVDYKAYQREDSHLFVFVCDDQTEIIGSISDNNITDVVGKKLISGEEFDAGKYDLMDEPFLEDGRCIIVVGANGWVSPATFAAIEARAAAAN